MKSFSFSHANTKKELFVFKPFLAQKPNKNWIPRPFLAHNLNKTG